MIAQIRPHLPGLPSVDIEKGETQTFLLAGGRQSGEAHIRSLRRLAMTPAVLATSLTT
jgi:hypothetical protein